jgi:hypothetical protein
MEETKKTNKAKKIFGLFDLDFRITKENIPRVLSYVLFVSGLILLYIANKYYAEKIIMRTNKVNKEIKELRAISITTKAELMNYSKQSEILKKAAEMGLQTPTQPPKKINTDDK